MRWGHLYSTSRTLINQMNNKKEFGFYLTSNDEILESGNKCTNKMYIFLSSNKMYLHQGDIDS
jgi:hypothetical protein